MFDENIQSGKRDADAKPKRDTVESRMGWPFVEMTLQESYNSKNTRPDDKVEDRYQGR